MAAHVARTARETTVMPSRVRRPWAGALAFAVLVAGTVALSAQPPGGEPSKKLDAPKEPPKADVSKDKDSRPLVIKLPDGTFLWLGAENGEKVTLTPQEFQKLLDRVESLKKDLVARKPLPPSACAVRAKVEKRGEQLVATLKLTYSFRTAQPNTAVLLGGRKAFLVGATLDGAKLPVLDTGEEGFAVLVETAGEHTLVLDVEAPVTARGPKAEVGFDVGLPRAPITTLALDPPPGDVKRVTVGTRTPDPAQPLKAPEVRRLPNLDVKQLTPRDGRPGLALGPVDSLEVLWDPPASAATPGADAVQSADLDVSVVLSESYAESTAKVRFSGPGREWRLVAPAGAEVTVDRVAAAPGEPGVTQQPVVRKPAEANKTVWTVELPAGSTAADWVVTAVVRQPRPKAGAKSAAVPVGPFAVLDVLRQTGTVKVAAGAYTRFVFKHGVELRRVDMPGPADDDQTVAYFRLGTGPTGTNPPGGPLLTVEAWPLEGAVQVRPNYRLELTDAGWQIRAALAFKPIRTEVEAVTIEVPAEWLGLESRSDSEIIESTTQGKADGQWRPVTVKLAGGQKKPFELVFFATVPVAPGITEVSVPLPRFPKAVERDAVLTATVPEGLEVRGTVRGWDGDEPGAWAVPLVAVPGPDGKVPKVVAAVTGRTERGLSRATLTWQPYRPDVTAETRAEVTIGERQVAVVQTIRLRAPDGFHRPVRFRIPSEAIGLRATPALDPAGGGVWSLGLPGDAKEATIRISYGLPLPAGADGPFALPVALAWPLDMLRTEATVRVWVNAMARCTVAVAAAGWRELPPEPAPERDVLPALTLAASGEHALDLEIRPAGGPGGGLRVERTLIEADAGEGGVSYTARYRLANPSGSAVEVVLPDSAGPAPTAQIDGDDVALAPTGADNGRRFRVALPAGASSRTVVLVVKYSLPGSRAVVGETVYVPPQLVGATYDGGLRWYLVEPVGTAPLVVNGRGRPELRWRLRGPLPVPGAPSRAAAEHWFATGHGPAPGDTAAGDGEPVMIRQASPEPVRVLHAPWLGLVGVCSAAVFVLVVALTWLPRGASGALVALVGGGFAAAVVLYPQAAAHVVLAALPGFALGVLALLVLLAVRVYARSRVRNLPGFTRTAPDPMSATTTGLPPPAPSVASSRSRPGSTGSAVAPAAPSGT